MSGDRFPVEAARDLLGLARAMYVVATRQGSTVTAGRLQRAGERLRLAIELAAENPPKTMGHRAAWTHADDAIMLLAAVIDVTTPAEPVLEAAADRVLRVPAEFRGRARRRPPKAGERR